MLRIALFFPQKSRSAQGVSLRQYTPSLVVHAREQTELAKQATAEYNNRRAAYKKQVSLLRKEYASEVALQRAADQAERSSRQKQETRRKLERDRIRNMEIAQSALREIEKRRQKEIEFQEELRLTQIRRDERKERFLKARKLLIDELEAEAPLWLTTHEEIEAAFTRDGEQALWAFPNSIIGAPSPTDDAKFWNYESHTWVMSKTYKTRDEAIYEELMEKVYTQSNIDMAYWTEERLEKRRQLSDKARLRAMVLDAGRRELLLKQKELLQDKFKDGVNAKIPRPMPVPNVRVLANEEALQQEGVDALFKDPTQFFEFNKEAITENGEDYDGPSLGVPIALKNPIIIEKTLGKAYPDVLGQYPPADSRSPKEKKRLEKERAMLAAARAKGESKEIDIDDDMDDVGIDEIDLDEMAKEEEDEWRRGLDPEADKDLLSLPPRERYTEDEIDAVIAKLQEKVRNLEDELDYELDLAQQQVDAAREIGVSKHSYEAPVQTEGKYTLEAGEKVYNIDELGLDQTEVGNLLSSFNDEQLIALHKIDKDMRGSHDMEELRKRLMKVPGLTNEQIEEIIHVEETIASNDAIKASTEDAMVDSNFFATSRNDSTSDKVFDLDEKDDDADFEEEKTEIDDSSTSSSVSVTEADDDENDKKV